jgi:RNA polymerase sigma-70 factor (ECF subfamily)
MTEQQLDRSNEDWISDLGKDGQARDAALETLRSRLERGLFYYLRNERSDLGGRSNEEIQQMTQDFVQDALLKILDNLDSFRGESQFLTWASKITTRVAISELRRARFKDYSLDYLTMEGEVMPSISSAFSSPDPGPRPERYTERQNVTALIEEAIQNVLTQRQRAALTAIALEGVPLEVVAERLGTNRNALYKLVHDARLKLKQHMEAEGLSMDYLMNLFGDS